MNKKRTQAAQELTRWLKHICYENGMPIQDSCPQLCKECGEGAWLIEDIKHKRGCIVKRMEKNLTILKDK